MIENKKFRLVLSFILACALWFYVVGQMNPTTRKTYRYIPIVLTNEQSLNDNGLAVLKMSDETLRVTVSAKRDVVNKLSKADITASVDLTDAAEGKNKLPIDIKIPEDVEIDNQSINDIEVTVEERVTKTRDVKVIFTGKNEEGSEPATIKQDPESIQVSGAKSLVDKVAYVQTEIDAAEISAELTSVTGSLTPVTSSGNAVNNISLSGNKCTVTAILYKTKSVKFSVPIKDDKDGKYTRSVSYKDHVTVKGPEDVLSGISEVSADEVDITGITENRKIKVVPVLPEGVQLAGKAEEVEITITVKKGKSSKKAGSDKQVKTFEFTVDDVVVLNNTDNAYSAQNGSLEVQVTGTDEQLSAISSSDIVLSVDAGGQTEDSLELKVNAELSGAYSDIAVIPSTITLIRNN